MSHVDGLKCAASILAVHGERELADAVESTAYAMERLEREAVILRYERERWAAAYDSSVKLLVGIHAVIYPMVVKLDDGREMRFNSPYLHEQMQAISDRIRAIPDELAAATPSPPPPPESAH